MSTPDPSERHGASLEKATATLVTAAVFVTLLTGTLLILPPSGLELLGLSAGVEANRGALGGALVACLALLATVGLLTAGRHLADRLAQGRRERLLAGRLDRLTPDEKQVLKGFVVSSVRRQALRQADGVVSELEKAGALVRSARSDDPNGTHFFDIQPWAWDYLNRRPELLLEPDELANRRRSMAQTLRR